MSVHTTWVTPIQHSRLTIGDLASDILDVLLIGQGAVEGDGGRLDSDTTFLLVRARICRTSLTGLAGRNDTGLCEERVGKSGLSVIDVGNDGHVAHVRGLVCEWC